MIESTYQYLFAGPQSMFGDRTSGNFDMRGMPLPYFLSTPVRIDPTLALEWLIERTASLGLRVAHCSIRRWDEPGYPDRIKELLAKHKLEPVMNYRERSDFSGQTGATGAWKPPISRTFLPSS
jgi:hypothetical protein